jgi:hypothetical protein
MKAVSNKSCISAADFLSLKQNNADVLLQKSAIRNHECSLHTTINTC